MRKKKVPGSSKESVSNHHTAICCGSYLITLICLGIVILDLISPSMQVQAEHTILVALALVALVLPFATKVSFEGVDVDLSDEERKAALPEGRAMVVPGSTDSPRAVETNEQTPQ